MHILYITPYVPTPIRVRPYSLLSTLATRGHQITLATLWNTASEREQLAKLEQKGIQVLAEQLPRLRSLQNCLRVLLTKTPLQAAYCWQPRLKQALDALLARQHFDVIHIEHLRGVYYGLALNQRNVPIVWDSVDCISHLFEQAVAHSQSGFGKWMTRIELPRTQRYESWLVSQFPQILVTSEVDKQAFLQLMQTHPEPASTQAQARARSETPCLSLRPHSQGDCQKSTISNKITVLPNGVDQAYFSPSSYKPEPETLVFSGKMSYHANVTMAQYLVREIMPHIWAERPTTKVVIVGQKPPPTIRTLAQDARVTVTGFVSDIRPYLQQATVAVAPLVYGAGIQNKVLEAMACGTPVVATERAIRALTLKPEHDILVANEAPAFARQVLRLLTDSTLRQTIGANGLTYVRKHHNWFQIGIDLETIYQSALEKTRKEVH